MFEENDLCVQYRSADCDDDFKLLAARPVPTMDFVNTQQPESYDDVLYPGDPFVATHPDRMATIAAIHGLQPTPIDRCRVLEIGCCDGGNLIPMAHALPRSEFTGIDLGARAVAAANERISALHLTNITVQQLDILDLPDDGQTYDYIIVHGVYSWVPHKVREKILATCASHLSADGVAFISYNAQPGGYFRDLARGMMRYHVREVRAPEEKRERGIELLKSLAAARGADDLYGRVLAEEVNRITEHQLAAFYHDDLADCRSAFYFHEFIEAASSHGLQFLSEASLPEMRDNRFPPDVIGEIAGKGADRLAREQYLDFLKERRFRQTLLCRGDRALTGENPTGVKGFFVSSDAKPDHALPNLDETTPEQFTNPGGAAIKTADGLAKAIMVHLAETSPLPCGFDALLEAADARRDFPGGTVGTKEVQDEYAAALLSMYAAGVVEFSTLPPSFTTAVGDRPLACAVARQQLASGAKAITNRLHAKVSIPDPVARELIRLLDGRRNKDDLAAALADYCLKEGIRFRGNDGRDLGPGAIYSVLREGLDANLQKVARMAVIVA
jgi:methyltransferase-like protein/2-polyprenyl-3-methyl-5-hydroxy-6-metoxy-1,4-benzoquinol methylase